MTENPGEYRFRFIDEKRGTDSSYVRERKMTSDFQALIRKHIGSFVKVAVTQTRWLNNQTDNDDEFMHSIKTIFGTLKSVEQNHIEVDVVAGEIQHDDAKRSQVATGVSLIFFRHEQYDFRRFREIVEMQEMNIEGIDLIKGLIAQKKENCA